MKYIAKYLSLGLLLSGALQGSTCNSAGTFSGGACAPIRTTWVPETVGQNLWTQYHKLLFPDMDSECCWVADLSLTYRFQQTRNSCQMASALWGSPTLVFQGSAVETRSNKALIAEYFGMGPDTNAAVTLCPRIRNQILDFQLAMSGEKFWVQINLPVVWSKYSLTPNCGAPSVLGTVGSQPLDGANIAMSNKQQDPSDTGLANNNQILVDTTNVTGTASAADAVPYNATGLFTAETGDTFVSVVTENTNVNDDQAARVTQFTPTGGNEINVGQVNMGLYGDFSTTPSLTAGQSSASLEVTTETVNPANNIFQALCGYTFGKVENRQFNKFNFNACGKWGLADIPLMVGYDFCKSDATHLGAYLKFVIPTGTQINPCFLQYVFSPVIGNGRHFEFGIGLTGHANFWVCDESSFGIYGDGYITRMFGACQTRTFDMPNAPMSRYALAYPIDPETEAVGSSMMAVGDVNLYNGNVSATRGEFMFDLIYAHRNVEFGIGYAFSGQGAESANCSPCTTTGISGALNGNSADFAYVGNALQQTFGVGPLTPAGTGITTETATLTAGSDAPAAPTTNFYYFGSTGQAAQMGDGENPILSYGTPASLSECAVSMPATANNCSGFMSGQVLNKIFAHLDYVWRDCAWQPELGILGSIGFCPAGKPTANLWDVGARLGFAF